MEKKAKAIFNIIVSIAVTACAVGLSIAYFCCVSFPFSVWVAILSIVVLLGAFFTAMFFYLKHNQAVFRLIIAGIALVAIVFVCLLIYENTSLKELVQDIDSLQKLIDGAGIWGPLVFIVLQFLQVVILPIPSTLSIAAGIVCFGNVECFFYSMIGILLGSVTAFYIGRFLGYKVVAWLVGKETLDEWLEKLKGKDKFFLSAMFLLPLFPDDVLCFVAGLSSMSILFFLVVQLVARTLAIGATCFIAGVIPFNTWWGILIWSILLVGIIVGLYFFHKYSDVLREKLSSLFHSRKKK